MIQKVPSSNKSESVKSPSSDETNAFPTSKESKESERPVQRGKSSVTLTESDVEDISNLIESEQFKADSTPSEDRN